MDPAAIKAHFEQALAGEPGKFVALANFPFVLAAVNADGHVALFARVSLSPTQAVNDGQGFSVKTTRSGSNDYVQITATDRGLPILFLKLVEYVVERVTTATSVDEGVEVMTLSLIHI